MAISFDDLRKAQTKGKNSLDSFKAKRLESLVGSKNEVDVLNNSTNVATREGLNSLRNSLSAKKEANNSISNTEQYKEMFNKRVENYSAQIIKEVDEQLRAFSLELVFVIDKSYSCTETEEKTLLGFTDLIQKEKNNGYINTKVTVDLFAKETTIIYNRNPIDEIKPFKYVADGDNTALYDCLGDRINCIKKKHIEEGSPTKTLFVIMTDGYDNLDRKSVV